MRRFLLLTLVAGLSLVVGALVAGFVELPADVAYYGQWSSQPQAGYLDHPGGVAWPLVLFGRDALPTALRLVPIATAFLNALLVVAMLSRVQATMSTAAAVFFSPLWLAGTLLWTPDAGLLLFWHLSLLLVVQDRMLWMLPFALAAMTCFKIVGLPLTLLLLWVYRDDRKRLRWLLIGAGASLTALMLTGLPSVLFQLQHRGESLGFRWAGPLETLLGQMAITGPALFLVGLLALRRWWSHRHAIQTAGDELTSVMGRLALGVIAAFLLVSFVVRVEPNWLAPALMPMTMAAAALFRPRPLRTPGPSVWPIVGLAQTLVLGAVIFIVFVPVLPAEHDPTARLHGWQDWAASLPADRAEAVLSDRYQWHAQLHLHQGTPGATFNAVMPGSAYRSGALDTSFDSEVDSVLFVWTERAPTAAVTARWPHVCQEGEGPPPPGQEKKTKFQFRTRAKCSSPENSEP